MQAFRRILNRFITPASQRYATGSTPKRSAPFWKVRAIVALYVYAFRDEEDHRQKEPASKITN